LDNNICSYFSSSYYSSSYFCSSSSWSRLFLGLDVGVLKLCKPKWANDFVSGVGYWDELLELYGSLPKLCKLKWDNDFDSGGRKCYELLELDGCCVRKWIGISLKGLSLSSPTLRFFLYFNIFYLIYSTRKALTGSTPNMRSSKLVIFGLIASL